MKTYKLDDFWGGHINSSIEKAKQVSIEKNMIVEFDFNGVRCLVNKDTDTDLLLRDYMNAHLMGWKEVGYATYEYSDELKAQIKEKELERDQRQKEQQEKWEKEVKEKRELFEKSVDGIVFAVSNEDKLKSWEENNKDGYGSAIITYAKNWGRLMQLEVSKGNKIVDVAEKCSHDADTEGMTGFMYGAAVSVLSDCWIHGEELRKWHNKEYNHEGDGVVNPAILTIKT